MDIIKQLKCVSKNEKIPNLYEKIKELFIKEK
jgi:hypothetical protein